MPRQRLFALSVIGTLLLAGVFFSVRLRPDATLENSLVDMSVEAVISPRAVLFEQGTVLAGDLGTRILTRAESPYLVRGVVRIPAGAVVTLEPGTQLAVAEGSRMDVEGRLTGAGTSFFSNQRHPRRRLWNGILVRPGGSLDLSQSSLTDASTAVTCGPGGRASIARGFFTNNTVAIASLPETRACTVVDSRIADGRIGIQAIGGPLLVRDTSFHRVFDGLRLFHDAEPTLTRLVFDRPQRAAVVSARTPPLLIRGLTLRPPQDLAPLILDGADAPTHRWRGAEYPTGRVQILRTSEVRKFTDFGSPREETAPRPKPT